MERVECAHGVFHPRYDDEELPGRCDGEPHRRVVQATLRAGESSGVGAVRHDLYTVSGHRVISVGIYTDEWIAS